MAGRYVYEHRKKGDVASASPLALDVGKKLLGYLAEQRHLGLARTLVAHSTLADGTEVTARFIGDMPEVTYRHTGEEVGVEEVIHLYASSSGGLRIIDLGTRLLTKTLLGLEDWDLQSVSSNGRIAWMVYQPSVIAFAAAARVDIAASTATNRTYTVMTPAADPDDPPEPGRAIDADAALLSPDGTRLLLHFSASGTTGGSLREGVGGVLLVDAETLVPLRAPIRMTFDPAPMAWAPDSSRFYLGCSMPDDIGDLPDSAARLDALTTSNNDYVVAFDANGIWQGAQAVASWQFAPDAGFARRVKALAATNERVYASVDGQYTSLGGPTLMALSPALSVAASLDISEIGAAAPPILCLSRGHKSVFVANGHSLATISLEEDLLSIEEVVTHAEYATFAPLRDPAFPTLQLGPASRIGGLPDNRRFLMNTDGTTRVLRAFRSFGLDDLGNPRDAYTLDLAVWGVDTNYRLASVGLRPRQTRTAA